MSSTISGAAVVGGVCGQPIKHSMSPVIHNAWIAAAGLAVAGRHDVRPTHAKAFDAEDPLHAARSREVTSLWRLRVA